MQVRFIRSFRGHEMGSIIEVAEDVARNWIEAGIAQAIPANKSLDTPARDKAIRQPSRKKALVNG